MAEPFLYDTHYQIDKPFALLDLTLTVASPSASASDHSIGSRLEEQARSRPVCYLGDGGMWLTKKWDINKDAFRYWLANCHDGNLLTRQNAYDYWLLNFAWLPTFRRESSAWGELEPKFASESRLLLFRWAWVHDAPMIIAILIQLAHEDTQPRGRIVENVDKLIVDVLSAIRDSTQDVRRRTDYRRRIAEIQRNGFRPNTRRHKAATHISLLLESGVIAEAPDGLRLGEGARRVLAEHTSGKDAIRESLVDGPIGAGGQLFLGIVSEVFDIPVRSIGDLTEGDWPEVRPRVEQMWSQIIAWDRKFLGIDALAEFFLVQRLVSGTQLWSIDSWKRFLLDRSRHYPDELTVHLGHFGEVKFLRLS